MYLVAIPQHVWQYATTLNRLEAQQWKKTLSPHASC